MLTSRGIEAVPLTSGGNISAINVIGTRRSVFVLASTREQRLDIPRCSSRMPTGTANAHSLPPAPHAEVTIGGVPAAVRAHVFDPHGRSRSASNINVGCLGKLRRRRR